MTSFHFQKTNSFRNQPLLYFANVLCSMKLQNHNIILFRRGLFHDFSIMAFCASQKDSLCVFSIVFFVSKNFINSEIKGSCEKMTGKVKQDLIPRKLICHSAWHPVKSHCSHGILFIWLFLAFFSFSFLARLFVKSYC